MPGSGVRLVRGFRGVSARYANTSRHVYIWCLWEGAESFIVLGAFRWHEYDQSVLFSPEDASDPEWFGSWRAWSSDFTASPASTLIAICRIQRKPASTRPHSYKYTKCIKRQTQRLATIQFCWQDISFVWAEIVFRFIGSGRRIRQYCCRAWDEFTASFWTSRQRGSVEML